jgi:4-hydroxybenzoate polyprenyltransferase
MQKIVAFFKLIRYPNLLYIILTQYLVQYSVIKPMFEEAGLTSSLSNKYFSLLVLSTVLIAAAGYIINDYFDINIDQINKPDKIIIDKIISRRWAMAWHTAMNIIAVLIAFWLSWKLGVIYLGLIQLFCTLLLWFYSTSLKRQLLIGNVVIALLTALTVLVVGSYEPKLYLNADHGFLRFRIIEVIIMFALFAFVISVIREIVKDLEDMRGDTKEGCRTAPIIWGIRASKNICYSLITLLLVILCFVQFKIFFWHWYLVIIYLLLAVQLPLILVIPRLANAFTPHGYHKVSNLIKIIMLSGILSMLFFKLWM